MVDSTFRGMDAQLPGSPLADPHTVYSALLDASILWDWHRDKLIARGLSVAEIDRRQYRTVDHMAVRRIVGRFGTSVLAVPGFVESKGHVRLNAADGILIPVREVGGRIVALKVRRDFGEPK